MVPCPYFLQSNCRFSEETCRSVYCIVILLSCHDLQKSPWKYSVFENACSEASSKNTALGLNTIFFFIVFWTMLAIVYFFYMIINVQHLEFCAPFSFRYSHGFLVNVEDLMPFKEPDFRWTIIINNLSTFQLHCWPCTSPIPSIKLSAKILAHGTT